MKKIITIALASLAALAATACWYQKANYNDYIATVNNFERHISRLDVTQGSWTHIQAIKYEVDNQLKVDFPVTMTMKLTSEKPIAIVDAYEVHAAIPTNRTAKVDARLEYRVLPHGNWVKVSEFSIDTGRLPESYPPAPYLGRNNINPKGLKAGDKIMVRLYVTDGQWQSGDPTSMCDATVTNAMSSCTYRYEFPKYRYTVKNVVIDELNEADLGGGWLPHYVVVLEYSGHTRPIN